MRKIKTSYPGLMALTHDLIGGKWKLQILWHIIQGDNRFSMLRRVMPEISEKVLGEQLRELESSGILERRVLDDRPPKVIEYHVKEQYRGITHLAEEIFLFTTAYADLEGIDVSGSGC